MLGTVVAIGPSPAAGHPASRTAVAVADSGTVAVIGQWTFPLAAGAAPWDQMPLGVDWTQTCQISGEPAGNGVDFGSSPVGYRGDGADRTVVAVRYLDTSGDEWGSPERADWKQVDGASFEFVGGTAQTGTGGSCSVAYVAFVPKAAGEQTGRLAFMAGSEPIASVTLRGTGFSTSTPAPTSNCAPYIVIDSRGSGSSNVASAPGRKFLDELRRLKAPQTVGLIRNPYPAKGWTTFVGAVLQLPAGYHQSVVNGEEWLRQKLAAETSLCGPSTKFFLTGYSQGAQVAADVYQRGNYPNVAGVAVFGDPYFNSRDTYVDRGDFTRGLSGNLGTRPRFDGDRRGRVLSFCHRHDPVCQGPLSYVVLTRYRFTRHTNYDKLGEPEQAARYFAARS